MMHNKPHTDEAKRKMSLSHFGKPNISRRREIREINGETLYKCGRCLSFLPYSEFYKNSRTMLGIKSECKSCHTKINILSRDIDKARLSNSLYMARARSSNPDKFRCRDREFGEKRRLRDHEKINARKLLNMAVKRGDITRPDACESCCNVGRITGHHDDYSKPLSVRWLCYKCHGIEHRKK